MTRIGQMATHLGDPGTGFASLQALNDRSQSLGNVIAAGQGARNAAVDEFMQVQLEQVNGFAILQAATVAELRDKLGLIYRTRKGAAAGP